MFIQHPLQPIYNRDSRILILGSLPSPKSREVGFYYGHPQNRFWRVLSCVLQEELPTDIPAKTELLQRRHIALWDVLAGCEITGAEDNSIRHPIANDFSPILTTANIQAVFTTGAKATALYQKLCFPMTGIAANRLPSTSPANCAATMEMLTQAYQEILQYL